MLNDDSTLTGRFKRYAKVSSALGNLAFRLAGEKYLGIDINKETHAEDLTTVLGNLKGPLMKVAQFLATVPGAIPPEYANELLRLQTDAPSMGWTFVRRRMTAELGPNWQNKFASFSKESAAAASLGQVHQAQSLDGFVLACKLQYPEMESVIEADLNQLKLLFSLYEKWGKALETDNVRAEIATRLYEELDYRHEASNLQLYQHIFQNDPDIQVPQFFPDLSTKRLLTMSWMEGESVLQFTESSQEQRNSLAKTLFRSWYYPLYSHAVIHGDPHPGNYKATNSGQVNLLDFGCIRVFSPSFIQGVIDLYRALQTDDRDKAVSAYKNWGFDNLNSDMIEIITQWAKLLYDPLLDDRIRPIQIQLDGQKGWEMATKVHAELERIGGIRPPREFVFMDRAAVGIGSVLMRLQAHQNWHQLFEELIQDFSIETVQKRQNKAFLEVSVDT